MFTGEWIVHEWGDKYQIAEAQIKVKEHLGVSMTGQHIIAKEITKVNANLIVAAANACKKINPNNPMAAAEAYDDMYKALTFFINQLEPWVKLCPKLAIWVEAARDEGNEALSKARG